MNDEIEISDGAKRLVLRKAGGQASAEMHTKHTVEEMPLSIDDVQRMRDWSIERVGPPDDVAEVLAAQRSEPPPGYELLEPTETYDGYIGPWRWVVRGGQHAERPGAVAEAWAHYDTITAPLRAEVELLRAQLEEREAESDDLTSALGKYQAWALALVPTNGSSRDDGGLRREIEAQIECLREALVDANRTALKRAAEGPTTEPDPAEEWSMNGPAAERLWRAAIAFGEADANKTLGVGSDDLSAEFGSLTSAAVGFAQAVGEIDCIDAADATRRLVRIDVARRTLALALAKRNGRPAADLSLEDAVRGVCAAMKVAELPEGARMPSLGSDCIRAVLTQAEGAAPPDKLDKLETLRDAYEAHTSTRRSAVDWARLETAVREAVGHG